MNEKIFIIRIENTRVATRFYAEIAVGKVSSKQEDATRFSFKDMKKILEKCVYRFNLSKVFPQVI